MKEYGHEFYYYENTEGGHAGSATLEQKLKQQALEFTFARWKTGLGQ